MIECERTSERTKEYRINIKNQWQRESDRQIDKPTDSFEAVPLSSLDLGSLALLSSKLVGARFPLYRSQILQENTRWKALAEIYTMHSFAP